MPSTQLLLLLSSYITTSCVYQAMLLYQFPVAAGTNHSKLGVSNKMHSLYGSGGWESEMIFLGSDQGVGKAVLTLETPGRKSVSCLFQLIEAAWVPHTIEWKV